MINRPNSVESPGTLGAQSNGIWTQPTSENIGLSRWTFPTATTSLDSTEVQSPNPQTGTPTNLLKRFQTSPVPEKFTKSGMRSDSSSNFVTTLSQSLSALEAGSSADAPISFAMDQMAPSAYRVFGGETSMRSPFATADDFAAWLFNNNQACLLSTTGYPISGSMDEYVDPLAPGYQGGYCSDDNTFGGNYSHIVLPSPMIVSSILDPESSQSMSEKKRQELLNIMSTRFNETSFPTVNKNKKEIMEGDIDDNNHILSLRMMQIYLDSFWHHCHWQLPILHKPTFTADKTPSLLLLAVVALGASTLDKVHSQNITDAAAILGDFIAWHLRWEIFKDSNFRPPVELWVLHALLLLEVYEKMYATRQLHERAHVYHDITLTLMRRGGSLIGRYDGAPRSAAVSSSISDSDIGNESWSRWVRKEGVRRAAFAAFVLDSIHATMFGHSAKMAAHEMRLPLPCDALWSATSAAEVVRVHASLQANGVKPVMFLDGLKKTLRGQKVRTNLFGRTILMAGLLSVSWHMNQRDLQVSSLGTFQAFCGRDKWRLALLRACDYWKRDFDEALAEESNDHTSASSYCASFLPMGDENIFESRTVLHHLSHMAFNANVIDCQIYAGASRLLGRAVSPRDYAAAKENISERWATKASARDAAFYAIKFLSKVLAPDVSSNVAGCQSGGIIDYSDSTYSARDNFPFNRPWVIYFAALIVWCYGYALEGPITGPLPDLSTAAAQEKDTRAFLERVGGVRAPDELENIHGRNRCLGLLLALKERFGGARWELLREASSLLGKCCEKLKGDGFDN